MRLLNLNKNTIVKTLSKFSQYKKLQNIKIKNDVIKTTYRQISLKNIP